MSLNLYLIKRVDGGAMDENTAHVIAAETAVSARRAAAGLHRDEDTSEWWDEQLSTIEQIGTTDRDTQADAEPAFYDGFVVLTQTW